MRCIALSGAADEGSYNSTSRELVMRISSSLPAGEAAEITVPPEATIRLPPPLTGVASLAYRGGLSYLRLIDFYVSQL